MENKQSLKDMVLASVFEDIIKGVYQPGDIIREKMLVEKYGVSKSPVRDALLELCNKNVLRCLPRYGYEVIRLTDRDLNNILDYRVLLEVGCANLSFEKITDAQIAELDEINRSCYEESYDVDVWQHWENNRLFHLKLISFYENEFIHSQLSVAMDTMTRAYAQFYWDQWHKSVFKVGVEGHVAIVNALKAHDKKAFLSELKKDIGSF